MKTSRKPRLVIADPSLVDAKGHHFALTLNLTRGAHALGVEVAWFTHMDFAGQLLPEAVDVYPVFSATMYDRYRPEKKNSLPADLDQKLLDELNEGISRSGLGKNDHIYFHTGYGDLYEAVPRYASVAGWENKPFLHICTPYDMDTMPGKNPGRGLMNVFMSMRTIEAVNKKIFFWAETPQLAQHYTWTFGFNMRALVLPPPHGIKPREPVDNQEVFTALYLGAAREEKGFLHLPELVERLYAKYGRTGKLQFIIQCSPQIIGYLPPIKAVIEKLSSYPASYVKLIDTVMDEQTYHFNLQMSDVVLLLYNKKSYKIRGSGIAVEALCADKCILTHQGTFCASLITHGGGAAVENIDEATAKLSELLEYKAEYRQRAKLQGEAYRHANSIEGYVRKIISQSTPYNAMPFLPSLVVGQVRPLLLKIH